MPVVERAFLTAYRQCLFEQRDCPFAQSLTPIGETDAFEELGTYLRLQARVSSDFFRAAVQQLFGSRLIALSIEWIGLGEHVHQECRHLLRPVALLGGGVPGQFDAVILPKHGACEERKTQENNDDAGHGEYMAPQKFAAVVAPIALSRAHRLTEQMSVRIIRERFHRRVSGV